ncbi:MAG TPA: DUF2334 domain-containing protein [Polyangiaceae bacterium]|jgi:hypothetical protein
MTMILLRDDDPNATTDPERLARCYAPLLEAGLPVNFSVIPRVALDTRAPDGVRERFLDERTPDSSAEVELTADTPLVRWLRENESVADVFVHGLSHRRIAGNTEFGALSVDEARARLDEAKRIFAASLGRIPVGFVAPWDALSAGSIEAAAERFEVVSTGWVDRSRLPIAAWPSHMLERWARREVLRVGSSWVLRHRGGKVSADIDPERVPPIVDELCTGADVGVIVLHHWMFWENGEPHPIVRALARALAGKNVVSVREAARQLATRKRGLSEFPAAFAQTSR